MQDFAYRISKNFSGAILRIHASSPWCLDTDASVLFAPV